MSDVSKKQVNISHLDKLYIDGAWVSPSSNDKIDVISPMSEEVVFRVAEAKEPDIDRAVAAARKAFDTGPWPRLSPLERADYLEKFAAEVSRRGTDLGLAWTESVGSLWSMAKSVAEVSAGTFREYAGYGKSFAFIEQRPASSGDGTTLLVREPVGVVAAIIPWNGPLGLASTKLAPALLAGCTVVLKASPESPIIAYILAEIADTIGLPKGVLNVVTAHRPVSEYLVCNPDVDKVSFTGSCAAGKRIASILGGRMARYTMELGGKSAAIVLDDMSVEEATKNIAETSCIVSGQICASLTRVIVPKRRRNEFIDGLGSVFGSLKPGNPYSADSDLGPLATKQQLERVENYVKLGLEQGAKLVVGGRQPVEQPKGYYYEPTVFVDVDNSIKIAQEEIFGPVVCLINAEDEQDAVRLANDSTFGLHASIFTHDTERAYEISRQIRAGNVSQRRFRTDLTVGFGGFKESGVGREGGIQGLLPYLESKTVVLDDRPKNLG